MRKPREQDGADDRRLSTIISDHCPWPYAEVCRHWVYDEEDRVFCDLCGQEFTRTELWRIMEGTA